MWIVWIVIGVLLIVAEMLTLTFYMLWLGIGALVAALIAWILPDAYLLQVICGGFAALGLTVFTKPLTRKVRHSKGFEDAIDNLVGLEGDVVQDIDAGALGIVKVGNETWSAKADEPIAKGEKVVVLNRSSTLVEVKRVKEM